LDQLLNMLAKMFHDYELIHRISTIFENKSLETKPCHNSWSRLPDCLLEQS